MSVPPSSESGIKIGELYYGGGMTVRVVDFTEDGEPIVRRLTGRGKLLKRASGRAVMPLHLFESGKMRPRA